MDDIVFPWDGRDQEEQAELHYNAPLRALNHQLEDENMNLKRLLREAGIPWNDAVASHPNFKQPSPSPSSTSASAAAAAAAANSRNSRRRSSRLSALDHAPHRLPHLPVEVILRIMEYALVAKDPIIDPLFKLTPETLTVAEAKRGPQTAIGFLATCKAYHTEAKRLFWTRNVFTFTSPETLRRFADLEDPVRNTVRHINLRIIARYYDDVQRVHKVEPEYHHSFNSAKTLNIIQRHPPEPNSLSRSGFRCYTWTQTIDFLDALRAPFDPARLKSTTGPRPKLLPQLASMRMDFVNFPDFFLPTADASLHEMAAHELGYTLDELMVTGLPRCEVGHRAAFDLQGLLKDDGLFMVHEPTYFQQKRSLKFLRDIEAHLTVVRSYHRLHKSKTKVPFPVVPEETGHPVSAWKKRKTIWKRVPISRDAEEREWVEFDRFTGENVKDLTDDSDEDVCPNCGIIHGLDSDITDFGSDDESI